MKIITSNKPNCQLELKFGDGETESVQIFKVETEVKHVYAIPGEYVIEFTAGNIAGAISGQLATVFVSNAEFTEPVIFTEFEIDGKMYFYDDEVEPFHLVNDTLETNGFVYEFVVCFESDCCIKGLFFQGFVGFFR